MSTYIQLMDSNGAFLYGNIPEEIRDQINPEDNKIKKEFIRLNKDQHNSRHYLETNEDGQLLVVTTDLDYLNSSKQFKKLIKSQLLTLSHISAYEKKLSINKNEYIQELVHNLTSINTYSIQELYGLIPQELLNENINKQKEVIKNILNEKPNVTVKTLLKLIKHNLAMKVEFSVFEKTVVKNPNIQKIEYSIRQIILSIIQIFIEDFEKKRIDVTVQACNTRVHLDHDIMLVSLFYIFENALKYCVTNSQLRITFKEEKNILLLNIDMISLKIEDNEVSKICSKRFRTQSAIELTDKGSGIGMNRVQKTLRLNDCKLIIKPRFTDKERIIKNQIYQNNRFIIEIDKNRII